MKKLNKKDIIYPVVLILTFLVLVFKLVDGTYLYGSSLDWYSQHISIPEYFRTLFYSTNDLFPDFAANIGSGQNIYNLSYYGLFSPIILISYLFPKVAMIDYLVVVSILSVIASTISLYTFLRKHKFNEEISFLSSFMFMASTSICFHSHRHIMFISYMPFLILGLFGVDKKMKTNNSWLLTISVCLMILTSYYFSIGGIVCLILYSLYLFLQKQTNITIKTVTKFLFNLAKPILLAICMSSILTIPTLLTMFNNRLDSNITISLKSLLLPLPSNSVNALYDPYGLGLTVIIIPALINIFKKNKANIILGIILSCMVVFNIFNYILNGTMYIDSKTLIPFLPLYIYCIAIFLKDLFNKKLNFKVLIPSLVIISIWLMFNKHIRIHYIIELIGFILLVLIYYKWPKKRLFIIPMFFIVLANAYLYSKADTLELKYETLENETIIKDALNVITDSDNNRYRIANNIERTSYPNKIFENINYYNSTIYSSISNSNYNTFYYDDLANNIPYRNRALTTSTNNVLSLVLTNNKYVISRSKPLQGYELVSSSNGVNIYRNNNVLPLAFATTNVMSYEDFAKLDYATQQEALLNVIVADTKSSNNFISNFQKTDLDLTKVFASANTTVNEDGSISIKTAKEIKLKYELPKKYQNKILFIRFNMKKETQENDVAITINSVKNKLTEEDWKYYNDNHDFRYMLSNKEQTVLNITIREGEYLIDDFEAYFLDYAYIEKVSQNVNKLEIDQIRSQGDTIFGRISTVEDGYFMITYPYAKGFVITVDNQIVDYEKVDNAFIGFPLEAGNHEIKIEYIAPGKIASIIISFLGTIAFIGVTIIESKRKL